MGIIFAGFMIVVAGTVAGLVLALKTLREQDPILKNRIRNKAFLCFLIPYILIVIVFAQYTP